MSFKLVLTKDHDGRRLDRTLRSIWPNLPLSAVMKGLRKGEVRLDSICARDPATRVRAGQELYVRWEAPEAKSSPRRWGPLFILWRGEGALLVNKPADLLVQPDKEGGDSVVTRVWGLEEGALTPGFSPAAVHRLDRNTTGVLIVALAGDSLRSLERLFKERDVFKNYLAVVVGKAPEKGEVNAPLLKDEAANRVTVDVSGKDSRTRFQRLAEGDGLSVLRVELLTGRTHQVRVHLAHAGHPILGDRKYGDFEANRRWRDWAKRPMLHAHELRFPKGLDGPLAELSDRSFKAPVPEDMLRIFALLNWNFEG